MRALRVALALLLTLSTIAAITLVLMGYGDPVAVGALPVAGGLAAAVSAGLNPVL